MGKKKNKNNKEKRKEALKALFKSDYFIQKIAILMKMESYPKEEIKAAFKKVMKRRAEESELALTPWGSNEKKPNKDDAFEWSSSTRLNDKDRRVVEKRNKNAETVNLISSILG